MASSLAWTISGTGSDAGRQGWKLTVVRQDTTVADPSLGDLKDADLVAACLDGAAGAFDVIVERHRRTISQLCYRFVSNHEDASDLSQDVFLRAYRGLKKFRGQSSLGTWLYRIGVNVCLNRVAVKTPPSESIDDRPHIDTRTESPADRVLRAERAGLVRAAVAKLPRKQRATLILRMYHDMSHQEIADIVGSSVGAVKANVFHALQNLKKLIGEDVV
ncbi:MAG TPA: sigma-70 family RNA polymerase sigma factor [Vicinamibacterales bacterium]|nr:sigma-70 family RNA polymerase sigma factor [Vicinamibacterales bacterium]